MSTHSRAVVIVSGGGAVSPFTTPDRACSAEPGFLSAGNTDTGLRDYLLVAGWSVFTAPASDDWGPVREPAPDSFGPFKDSPVVLPDTMTMLSSGDIDNAGEKLHRFITYLASDYGVREVDFIGHSNGGLYARAAIRLATLTGAPYRTRSLITMGTPHCGSVPGRMTLGELTAVDAMGDAFTEKLFDLWPRYLSGKDKGLNIQDTEHFLMGPAGWNAAQGSVLDGIPVTLMAGTYFAVEGGNPTMWPYDGLVSEHSAWAVDVPESTMPIRSTWSAPLTHSIFISNAIGTDWQTALTWNTAALERVQQALDAA
ncbi:MAG: esterase/lipase family protein [Actinomycetota bacterium]